MKKGRSKISIKYALIPIILFAFVIILGKSFAIQEEVKSITIKSTDPSYENKEKASYKVDKSAEWIDVGKARITFKYSSILKEKYKNKDIIFVLDTSGSMAGTKLTTMISDTKKVAKEILSNSDNRIAVISFDDESYRLNDFSNDYNLVEKSIDNMYGGGGTSYYAPLKEVDQILNYYKRRNDTDTIVMFLSDGYPCVDMPNEVGEYKYLKEKYPYLTINAVQYEVSGRVIKELQQISDFQYIANRSNLIDVIKKASTVPEAYDKVEITDYLEDKYFEKIDTKSVTIPYGNIQISDEGNGQKLTWQIPANTLKTGDTTEFSIDVNLKEEYKGNLSKTIYANTNKKESIMSILKEKKIFEESSKSPVLKIGYKVTYDANLPSDCKIDNLPGEEYYNAFSKVKLKENLSCKGYSVTGWKIMNQSTYNVNNTFIMPAEDVLIRAIWGKNKIVKSMDGKVEEKPKAIIKKMYEYNNLGTGSNITKIVFQNELKEPDNVISSEDISTDGNGLVLKYIASNGDGTNTVYIQASGKIYANEDSSYLFYRAWRVASIEGLENLDTSDVTNMSYMFGGCSALTAIDLSHMNTKNVTNMSSMFASTNLETIDVSSFDTSSLIKMHQMFSNNPKLTRIDLSTFKTDNVTDMSALFWNDTSLNYVNFNNINTSKVTTLYALFDNCTSLVNVDLSNFDTTNVMSLQSMFNNCKSLMTVDLSNFYTPNLMYMSSIFNGCTKLESVNISHFNTAKVQSIQNIFSNCENLKELDLTNFDTSSVTDMGQAFYKCKAIRSINLSSFDVSKVTNMSYMFEGCNNLAELDLSSFHTSPVDDLQGMFQNCYGLKKVDISNFKTPKLNRMDYMFENCYSILSIDLPGFTSTNLTTIGSAFACCYSVKSINLSQLNTSKIVSLYRLFYCCYNLESLDLTNFTKTSLNASNGLENTFTSCTSLKNINLSGFDFNNASLNSAFMSLPSLVSVDLSNIKFNSTSFANMFKNCYNLSSVNFSGVDTSKVTSMDSMFTSCYGLTSLDLSSFTNIPTAEEMFSDCINLVDLNIKNATLPTKEYTNMFTGNNENITIKVKDNTSKTYIDKMLASANGGTVIISN